jgi:hypothetical protein
VDDGRIAGHPAGIYDVAKAEIMSGEIRRRRGDPDGSA